MFNSIIKFLFESVKNLLPLIAVILFFQFLVLRAQIPNLKNVIIGLIFTAIGLIILIQGLEIGLFPMGENLGILFAQKGSIIWTIIFAICLGYASTLAEPSLIVVSLKAEEISQGIISQWGLRNAVAIGVALGISFGIIRIILNISLSWSLLIGYIVIIILTKIAPQNIIGLAYDCGGIIAGPVTATLVTALGIGISSSISGCDPYIDGFGLIGFVAMFSTISVLSFSVFARYF
ncbi:MAG: DUF1538 domain-containing protein [Nitrospirae bacterium]|nr:DUF1538 domain-containing protein [Nitrospirota bacterium]MBF0540433.1 DUF1538 domain-containing protein [Nitrospirota bacterium]